MQQHNPGIPFLSIYTDTKQTAHQQKQIAIRIFKKKKKEFSIQNTKLQNLENNLNIQ